MRIRSRIVWAALLAGVLALIGLNMGLPTLAQGGTPTPQPSPTGNGGNATWTINAMTFESKYPDGFEFTIEATSSAGRITAATALWRHSPISRARAAGQLDETGTKAVASWRREGQGVPQWVSVEYWWLLTDEAGNTYETDHKIEDYYDYTRGWSKAESEDIIVFWEEGVPDEIGAWVIQAMADQREFYRENWPRPLGYRPRAIIYNSYDTWREWAPGIGTVARGGPQGGVVTAGRTDSYWGATAQIYEAVRGPQYTAYVFVLHEVAHLYQYANGAGGRGDFWFIEGNASYFELLASERERVIRRVRGLAANGTLPSLQGGGPSARGAFALDAYDVGRCFFIWLTETYGQQAHRTLYTLIAQGRPWKDALQTVTQLNFVDMDTAFRTWLGASNPVAPTPIPEPTVFFLPSPTFEPTPVGK